MCLWAGANPRHSVSDGGDAEDDWTMTAFERAISEGAPEYLKKLGFDPGVDDIEPLYEAAHEGSAVEVLAEIQPPKDWHPITERFLDRSTVRLDFLPAAS